MTSHRIAHYVARGCVTAYAIAAGCLAGYEAGAYQYAAAIGALLLCGVLAYVTVESWQDEPEE